MRLIFMSYVLVEYITIAWAGKGGEKVHFKIHVPEVINHHHHTKYVYVHKYDDHDHDNDKDSYYKPPPYTYTYQTKEEEIEGEHGDKSDFKFGPDHYHHYSFDNGDGFKYSHTYGNLPSSKTSKTDYKKSEKPKKYGHKKYKSSQKENEVKSLIDYLHDHDDYTVPSSYGFGFDDTFPESEHKSVDSHYEVKPEKQTSFGFGGESFPESDNHYQAKPQKQTKSKPKKYYKAKEEIPKTKFKYINKPALKYTEPKQKHIDKEYEIKTLKQTGPKTNNYHKSVKVTPDPYDYSFDSGFDFPEKSNFGYEKDSVSPYAPFVGDLYELEEKNKKVAKVVYDTKAFIPKIQDHHVDKPKASFVYNYEHPGIKEYDEIKQEIKEHNKDVKSFDDFASAIHAGKAGFDDEHELEHLTHDVEDFHNDDEYLSFNHD